jgi:isopentenyl-diphosphate delta-isomerase
MIHVRVFIAICWMRAYSALAANSFTPWFKLIARDFLFGWWDTLVERKGFDGRVYAKTLTGVADGSKVIKMV